MKLRLNTAFASLMVMVLATLASCSRKVTEAVVSNTQQRDSIVYVETTRIDTFRTPAERIKEFIELECDSSGSVRAIAEAFRKGRASVVVTARDNTLTIEANCDSLERLIVSKDVLIDKLRETSSEQSRIKETKINFRVPWIYRAALWVAIFYLSLTVLWILWKVFRTYLKAQFPFIP
jgi:hypothetical protein